MDRPDSFGTSRAVEIKVKENVLAQNEAAKV